MPPHGCDSMLLVGDGLKNDPEDFLLAGSSALISSEASHLDSDPLIRVGLNTRGIQMKLYEYMRFSCPSA